MPAFPFEEIQANILKGHGRDHAWCLFFSFRTGAATALATWLKNQVVPLLTSAQRQIDDSAIRKVQTGFDGGLVAGLALAASAYAKLGIPEAEWPEDAAFREGMKARGPLMKDPPVDQWESGYQGEVEAMLLLADHSIDKLRATTAAIRESATQAGIGELLITETGQVLQPGGPCREHFGFVDSISQPAFWDQRGRFHETSWKLALEHQTHSPHRYGSYLVFRKLEQNVRRFNEQVRNIARHLYAPNAIELAEAQTMGRFRNGMPLTLSSGDLTNDFEYLKNTDAVGSKCPFHAHMRKANSRDRGYKAKQLTRRGIPYGHRRPDLSDEPETGVGLLFMSYQSVVANFEEIQIKCNDPGPDADRSTMDPIIGQSLPGEHLRPQAWNKKWHDPDSFPYLFQPVVRLLGGGYFFVPSISYLKNL